jgi:hypothetical protein
MRGAIYTLFFGFPIWWLAQTLLCLRDYFRRRHEIRGMPPASEDEKEMLRRARAEIPPKEKKPMRWYAEHPYEAIRHGWIFVPALLFFWPIALLLFTLPPIEARLSPEMLQRLKSERL